MRINTWILISLVILAFSITFFVYFFIWPAAQEIYVGMKIIETQEAYRADYSRYTTPLPQSVLEDICKKLEIETISENCASGNVVYAPDLFDEIKEYFSGVPDQEKTYDLVQDKLELYLVACEEPASDGHFTCEYDIRGDSEYPIFFYFDKNGFYYRIIANTGGS